MIAETAARFSFSICVCQGSYTSWPYCKYHSWEWRSAICLAAYIWGRVGHHRQGHGVLTPAFHALQRRSDIIQLDPPPQWKALFTPQQHKNRACASFHHVYEALPLEASASSLFKTVCAMVYLPAAPIDWLVCRLNILVQFSWFYSILQCAPARWYEKPAAPQMMSDLTCSWNWENTFGSLQAQTGGTFHSW